MRVNSSPVCPWAGNCRPGLPRRSMTLASGLPGTVIQLHRKPGPSHRHGPIPHSRKDAGSAIPRSARRGGFETSAGDVDDGALIQSFQRSSERIGPHRLPCRVRKESAAKCVQILRLARGRPGTLQDARRRQATGQRRESPRRNAAGSRRSGDARASYLSLQQATQASEREPDA